MSSLFAPLAPETSVDGPPSRVLHILPDLQIGGGQTIVLNGLRYADRSRFSHAVCYLLEDDEMLPAFVEAGYPPCRVPHRDGRGLATVQALSKLIRSEHIDLIHLHSDLDRTYGQPAALLTRTPVVSHLHGAWVHFGPKYPESPTTLQQVRARVLAQVRDRIERRTVRHYLAESVDVEELFEPLVDVPITVVQQSMPVDGFDAASSSGARDRVRRELGVGDVPLLINVSRLVDGKGQEHLVAAMASLRDAHPDAVLVLVGDGERRSLVEDEVTRAGLGDRVRFLGNRFDVPDLLTAADVFVFGSETEGFGMVALEAMAARKPVVAFRLPALQEFVSDGTTGYLVDLLDVPGLTRAIDALLTEPARAGDMGAAGRRVVDEQFRPSATATSFETAYRAVLGATVPRAVKGT